MRITFQYRLRPTSQQVAKMETWLELLRKQYNYRLWERFNWYECNRSPINACPLVCHLPQLKDRPNYNSQANDLLNTKTLFPEYKEIYSQVLQECVKRVEKTYERWVKKDSNGKRSGRPRFKGKRRYRSFTYPQIKQDCLNGKFITLPKIGKIKLILHRPIPDGFKIKTVSVIKKADGWYVALSLEDKTVPVMTPDNPTLLNTMGIDMGLTSFLVTDTGEEITIPQYYRKSEKKLKKISRQFSRTQKGSNRRKKAAQRLAKHHQKVANQRKDFHYKTVKKLLSKNKNIAHEGLNIKGLAKTRFSKSINDAGWRQFLDILAVKAASAGLTTIAVNPNGTTQECSQCEENIPKTLKERWHCCFSCGLLLPRDWNAALNVKYRAAGRPVLKSSGNVRALARSH